MTTTQTAKQYGELAVAQGRSLAEQARTPILAAVGAGDLAVREARARATDAVDIARSTAQQLAGAVRPDALRGTVAELVETARTQATSTLDSLAERGAGVVAELRRQPGFRRVVRRAEDAVDSVEDALEDLLEETAEAVVEASNEVTSVAQKTAARAGKVAAQTESSVDAAAAAVKDGLEDAVEPPQRATTVSGKKSSAARTSANGTATARVTRARTAERTDPAAVPAKRTDG